MIADFESLSHQSIPYLNGGQPVVTAVSKSDGSTPLCLPRIRSGNIDDEVHQESAL
jgi:hypothetical protein